MDEGKREKKEIVKRTNVTTPIVEPTSVTTNMNGISSPKNSTEDECCLNLTTSKEKQSLDPTESEKDNFDRVKAKQCLDPTRTKTKTCGTVVVPVDSTSPNDPINAVREEDVVTTSNLYEEDLKEIESSPSLRDNGETTRMKNKKVDGVTSKLQSYNTFRRSQQTRKKKFSSVKSSNDNNAYRKVKLIPTKNLSESDSSSISSSSPSPPGINDLADDVPIDVNARQNLQRLKELLADRRERFFDVVGSPRLLERSESSRGIK